MFLSKLQIIFGVLALSAIFILISISKDAGHVFSVDKNTTAQILFTIRGASMEPTLKDGERVSVDANYYKTRNLSRGDIVAFKLKTQEKPFVKRIVALEGDKLEFGEDGNIYLNGEKLEEPYLQDEYHFDQSRTRVLLIPLNQTNSTVPEGTVLVLGDNRKSSFDSENYGFVPKEYVVGKISIKPLPISQAAFKSTFIAFTALSGDG